MANTIGFGQAAVNNTIDYGQGAIDNTINVGVKVKRYHQAVKLT